MSVEGEDYFPVSSQAVTFSGNGPLTQEVCFSIAIFDDSIAENNEFFVLEIEPVVPQGVVIRY